MKQQIGTKTLLVTLAVLLTTTFAGGGGICRVRIFTTAFSQVAGSRAMDVPVANDSRS